MLIHELLNKDPDIVTEESPLVLLDSKSDMCMANNGKDTKHTRHLASRMHCVSNGEKCKMHKIDRCEGGLQLADISTNILGRNVYQLQTYLTRINIVHLALFSIPYKINPP